MAKILESEFRKERTLSHLNELPNEQLLKIAEVKKTGNEEIDRINNEIAKINAEIEKLVAEFNNAKSADEMTPELIKEIKERIKFLHKRKKELENQI